VIIKSSVSIEASVTVDSAATEFYRLLRFRTVPIEVTDKKTQYISEDCLVDVCERLHAPEFLNGK
jgi:hypothetical protein